MKTRGLLLGVSFVTLLAIGCETATPPLPANPPNSLPDPAKAKKDKTPAPTGPDGLAP